MNALSVIYVCIREPSELFVYATEQKTILFSQNNFNKQIQKAQTLTLGTVRVPTTRVY